MFTFKLQSVLDARKTKEEQVLAEFVEQTKALEKERQTLVAMDLEKERLLQRLREEKEKLLRPGDVELQLSYIKAWNRKIALQRNLILKLVQELEKKRRNLLDVMKDRKILENLKERHLKEYNLQQSSREQIAADETAVLRHERKEQ
ncbi:MAG TPA: flagellar export protein FliJ [Syntrophales bacterium]|nr:flagellar export protein FliJ [Syntrophales bacterium]HON22745.1 flagellar export protein FliJ [Syntrophales bacterium]HOU77068.1 flagellar export protein FliJ [Syntrophales bacterium]HPC33132.1 flagellar export protein FliJ [Syntrophales bacterium]HQG35309.1 flagellar export protein FliJ [Syntrophales bacterium]